MRAQYDPSAAAGRRAELSTGSPAKALILGLLAGVLLGSVAGVTGGLILSPLLFPAAPGETLTASSPGDLLGQGSFIQVDPTDPLHYGMGSVRVHQHRVDLGADFEVGPGPKYHLYLVPEAEIAPYTRVEETLFVDLGPLQAFAGAQSYPIPAGVDPRRYPSLVIWSEHLNLLISPAQIRFSAAQ